MDLLSYLFSFGNVLLFLVALGVIIFVHELGHFAVAKWVGIRVEQFAIGFGKAALAWRRGIGFRVGSTEPAYRKRVLEDLKRRGEAGALTTAEQRRLEQLEELIRTRKQPDQLESFDAGAVAKAGDALGLGETEYRLNWIPLGGYVKMLGQDDLDPSKVSRDPRAYNNKPIWARMCVISAGVVMNLITAVIFFIIAFMWGVNFPPALVGEVEPGSPAATAAATNADVIGLRPGDRLLAIDGDRPSDFAELRLAAALAAEGESLRLLVERPAFDGQPARRLRFSIEPETGEQQIRQLGILPAQSTQLPALRGLDGQSRQLIAEQLAEFGLEPGMELVAVDGAPIEHHWQYTLTLHRSGGEPLALTFRDPDGGQSNTIEVEPRSAWQTSEQHTVSRYPERTELVPHLAGFVPAVKIVQAQPGSPAEGKLKSGDVVAQINDIEWPTIAQMIDIVTHSEGEVDLTVIRAGERVGVTVQPAGGALADRKLGVMLEWAFDESWVGRVIEEAPAGGLEIPVGSRVLSIAGDAVADFTAMRHLLQQLEPGPVEIAIEEPLLGGRPATVTLNLTDDLITELRRLPWNDPVGLFEAYQEPQVASSPWEAAAMGFDKTWLFLKQTYVTLARLVQGSVSPKHLSGPVGITVIGSRFAERGISYLLYFMGLISVNLAVINFLPFPVVDGGHMVMLAIEKVRGKPLPVSVQSAITLAGLILLAAVFLFVTYHDIVRWVSGGYGG